LIETPGRHSDFGRDPTFNIQRSTLNVQRADFEPLEFRNHEARPLSWFLGFRIRQIVVLPSQHYAPTAI
jgi:hypothetical protein